jgi:hypothetical protein
LSIKADKWDVAAYLKEDLVKFSKTQVIVYEILQRMVVAVVTYYVGLVSVFAG